MKPQHCFKRDQNHCSEIAHTEMFGQVFSFLPLPRPFSLRHHPFLKTARPYFAIARLHFFRDQCLLSNTFSIDYEFTLFCRYDEWAAKRDSMKAVSVTELIDGHRCYHTLLLLHKGSSSRVVTLIKIDTKIPVIIFYLHLLVLSRTLFQMSISTSKF